MQYDPRALEDRLSDPDTGYIVVYPDHGIDLTAFTHDLRALLTRYHRRGEGWTIGSNIEIAGRPLVDTLDQEPDAAYPHPGI
jgi:hypothetical protein